MNNRRLILAAAVSMALLNPSIPIIKPQELNSTFSQPYYHKYGGRNGKRKRNPNRWR